MSENLTDRESSTDIFREWLGSLPVSSNIAARGQADLDGTDMVREKAWLDEQTIDDPS